MTRARWWGRHRTAPRPPRLAYHLGLAHDRDDDGPVVPMTRKEHAPCCVAKRDDLGRLPIGFCGPDCIRRAERDRRLGLT